MSAEPDLVDRGVHSFESELEILVEQYRVGLPPQRLAEIFGRFLLSNACAAMAHRHFSYASAGFVAILEAIREMSRDQPR